MSARRILGLAVLAAAAAVLLYGLFGQSVKVRSLEDGRPRLVRGPDLVAGAVRRTIKFKDGSLVEDKSGAVECPT